MQQVLNKECQLIFFTPEMLLLKRRCEILYVNDNINNNTNAVSTGGEVC